MTIIIRNYANEGITEYIESCGESSDSYIDVSESGTIAIEIERNGHYESITYTIEDFEAIAAEARRFIEARKAKGAA